MDPVLLLDREVTPQEVEEAMKKLTMHRKDQDSNTSNGDDEDSDVDEFDHDIDYGLFKLKVQEEKESPWGQRFLKKQENEETPENDVDDTRGENENDDTNSDEEDSENQQPENLSVTGVLWAMLANMEKQGIDVLESPFSPSLTQVLGLAKSCQALLLAWHNRFVREGACWATGPAERLVSMRGTEIGDYKLWLNYYQVVEGARAIMRRLCVGRLMKELGSEAEFNSLSREIEAVVSLLQSVQDLSNSQSLEETVSSVTFSKGRAARLVEFKYLLRVKACLVDIYEWFRFIMFYLGENHITMRTNTKHEALLDIVVSGELNIKRAALVTSFRLLQSIFKEIVEDELVTSCSNNILVTDSFFCLGDNFDFLDYTGKGYKMPCHIVNNGDGSYKYVQIICGGWILEVKNEDGSSEDEKEIVWKLPNGNEMKSIEIASGLGDYLLLRGTEGDELGETEDEEYSSDENDEDPYFGIYSISKNEMVVKNLDNSYSVEFEVLCYGKDGDWVTFAQSVRMGKPFVGFWTRGALKKERLCDNCIILATSPYWVVMENVVQSKIIIFNTVEMKIICSQKMNIDETDILTINQTSSKTNFELAIISPSSSAKVKFFHLNINEGKLKEKLKFSIRKHDNYLKIKKIMEDMGGSDLNSHNRHIVIPSPSADSSVLPLKWTVYDVSSKGGEFVEMDSVEDFQMVDDRIMFSFSMTATIVHLSFGLSIEDQVIHDFKMAEKVLLGKNVSQL